MSLRFFPMCHIDVLIFHFLQYYITFFLFKICTSPVRLKMDKSKTAHFSFEKYRGMCFIELVVSFCTTSNFFDLETQLL